MFLLCSNRRNGELACPLLSNPPRPCAEIARPHTEGKAWREMGFVRLLNRAERMPPIFLINL
jgi:hypothetical protein